MQILYSIYVNQGAFTEYAPNVSIEAACIFNFMQQKVALKEYQKHTIKENDNLYFWFSHSLIEEQMPILFKGSKTSAAISLKVRRLINELEENGIIERHPNAKSLKRSMYCFTDKADRLVTKETYKSERVIEKQTYKSERVRRTNLNESKPFETYKNEREVEYQSNLVEYNKVERESEKEFSQPPPPVSEIQNLVEVDPDQTNNDILINQPIIQNGKLIDSHSTKKTISKTSFKAGGRELLEKDPFSLAQTAFDNARPEQISKYEKFITGFKKENLLKYYLQTLFDFFKSPDGLQLTGISTDATQFVEAKFMGYAYYIIEKVNAAEDKNAKTQNQNDETTKIITWSEYAKIIQIAVKTQQLEKKEADFKLNAWGTCFNISPYKGTIAEFEKWFSDYKKQQSQTSC